MIRRKPKLRSKLAVQRLYFLAHRSKSNARSKGKIQNLWLNPRQMKSITRFIEFNHFINSCSRFNRTKIRWSKNSKFLAKTRNVKLSKKGALRVLDVSYRDAGIYGCHAGFSTSELRLRVKPKPGDREPTPADYESIEEDEENVIEVEDGKCFDSALCVCVCLPMENT